MPLPPTKILHRAERLASSLAGGHIRVERNTLLAVVADFMTDPKPDLGKLRRTLDFLAGGSGGHLKRGGSYAAQIKALAAELLTLLDAETLETEDYRSLFGWAARLLLVRDLGEPPLTEGASLGHSAVSDSAATARTRKENRRATTTPAQPKKLGGVGERGLGALQQLKQRLEEREKRDDKP